MSENISQTLGFDAQSAIASLAKLDQALATLQERLKGTAGSFQDFNKSSLAAADAISKLGSNTPKAMAAVARSTTTSMDTASDAVGRLTTSMTLLSRILFTQLAVKGFRILTQGAANATRQFADFEKGLSEIQALDPASSLDELGASSKKLSNQFNVKLMDVVAARLDLVGSGFVSAAEQSQVFSAAAGLAKLGAASQAEATDLLISSLNAYGESADSAAKFSRVFFAGADKGRFTIKELAANMGKAAPSFRAAGGSIEELTSLFSALTVAGVNPAEAATQANALAVAFLKPSEDMKAALKALNIESGQALIAQEGLAGAVQKVLSTTDGSAAATARLFQNQRALKPVLTLNADGWARYNEHLKNTQTLSQQEFDFRLAQRLGTDSERATAALNKLRNAVVDGLGGGIVQTAANFDRLTGSVDGLANVIENFFRVISGHGVQVFESEISAALKNVGNQAIDQVLQDWNKFIAKVGADNEKLLAAARSLPAGSALPLDAKSLPELEKHLRDALDTKRVIAFDDVISRALEHLRENQQFLEGDAIGDQMNAVIFALKKLSTQAEVTEADLKPVRDVLKSIEDQAPLTNIKDIGTSLGAAERILELMEKRSGFLNKPAEDANKVVDSLGQLPTVLRRSADELKKIDSLLQSSVDRVAAIQQKSNERAFQQSISHLTDSQQSFLLSKRASDLASEAAQKLIEAGKAGDKKGIDQALKLFDQADKAGEAAANTAQRADDVSRESLAMKTLAENAQRRLDAERQLQTVLQQQKQPQAQPQPAQLKTALEQAAVPAERIKTAMQQTLQPVGQLATGVAGLVAGAQAAATAFESMAKAAGAAAQAAAAGAQAGAAAGTQAKMHGGPMRYLASGGSARGTDTIPAMLSRGEFVVNAKSSRQFFSQLQAINAGVTPTFRGDGGSVTNNTGDISINVSGASSPKATGRAVIDSITRELRKGTRNL